MFYNDDNEESDDEWFYSSFKRYDDLLMYDVHGAITTTTFRSNDRLFLAASGEKHHEVWELNIPKKVIAEKDSSLTRDRDFSLLTAGYTVSPVRRMLPFESGLLTSEFSGIYFYSVPDAADETDMITLKMPIIKDIKGPPMTALGSKIYWAKNISRISSFDFVSQQLHDYPLPSSDVKGFSKEMDSGISEMCCKDGLIYLCLMNTGSVVMHDPRTTSLVCKGSNKEISSEKWTMAVSENSQFIATLSSSGSLNVYDNRDQLEAVFETSVEVQGHSEILQNDLISVNISPTNTFVSVSGFDRNVQIFNFGKNGKDGHVFSHDGHRSSKVNKIVTHSWHPVQENLMFSADDTGQLQAWRFKISNN